MTAFVLDVSVTMAWCFEDEAADATWKLLDRLADDTALVPGIWAAEVANVLLVAERRRRITRPQSRAFAARLLALPILVEETAPSRLLSDVLALGRKPALQLTTHCTSTSPYGTTCHWRRRTGLCVSPPERME